MMVLSDFRDKLGQDSLIVEVVSMDMKLFCQFVFVLVITSLNVVRPVSISLKFRKYASAEL